MLVVVDEVVEGTVVTTVGTLYVADIALKVPTTNDVPSAVLSVLSSELVDGGAFFKLA